MRLGENTRLRFLIAQPGDEAGVVAAASAHGVRQSCKLASGQRNHYLCNKLTTGECDEYDMTWRS